MSQTNRNFRFGRSSASAATLGLIAFMSLGAPFAAAQSGRNLVNERAFHMRGDLATEVRRTCIPANGAQILGGFAGPEDLLDVNTGEICGTLH